ncbi:MAG: V-type ATP synthase subunit I [Spirochaetaceae bacterium]|nr:MAG: V-type ATP synthase subunit I [Spirochaetaceae bacterium]
MIERMKKATVITLESRRQATVEQMRDLGVLHLDVHGVESGELSQLLSRRSQVERAMAVIQVAAESAGAPVPAETAAGGDEQAVHALCERLIAQAEESRKLREEIERLERDAARLEPWGDFAPAAIEQLGEKGVTITLHVLPPKEFQRLEKKGIFLVRSTGAQVFFAQITFRGQSRLDLDEVSLPEQGLATISAEIDRLRARVSEIAAAAVAEAPSVPQLRAVIRDIEAAIEFEQVHTGMDAAGPLVHITGFVPEGEVDAVKKSAASAGWGLVLRDPVTGEQVPTRVKNPKPIRIIQPVFDLLGTVPGYRELDISVFFLVFFTGFFAMIIGDAGYGVVLLGISLFALFKAKSAGKPTPLGLILMTVLSVATIAWGAVTGNWFGYEGFAQLPFLSWMIVPAIYSFDPRSAEVVQWACFVIGTIHLSIAHGWNFLRGLRERPRIRSLAQLGWLSMVIGLYHLVLTVVLGWAMPDYALPLIVGGFAAVVVFSMQEQGQNFFKGILMGVANLITLALSSVSAFSDIISYIRLFAVGLATVAIAASFNAMALGMADGIVGSVAAVLVLFMGHTLNLAMAALAVIVHGVRLNMLEFSNHLGMEWSGVQYRPFQNQTERTA